MEWEFREIEKKIKIERIFTAFENEFSEGHIFSGESHDFWELVYVIDGEVCVSADERVLNLGKNDIIFHKPLELHKFHTSSEKKAHLFIFTFSASGELMKEFENCAVSLSPEQREYIFNLINLLRSNSDETNRKYISYMEYIKNSPCLGEMAACFTELFLLSFKGEGQIILTSHDSPDAVIFKKAVEIMEKRISDWISVPELARECSVSVSYLKKIFGDN